MAVAVGMKIATRITTGISVHTISSRVFPWNCEATRPGRSRNQMERTSVAPSTATKTTAASQKTMT